MCSTTSLLQPCTGSIYQGQVQHIASELDFNVVVQLWSCSVMKPISQQAFIAIRASNQQNLF